MSHELKGIRGNEAIGFMVGAGLIRVAPEGVRLSWHPARQTAVVDGISTGDLIDHLVVHMRNRQHSPELHIADDVRGFPRDDFRTICREATLEVTQWVRCWWREDGDALKPTNLCFTSGQQRMISMARNLAAALESGIESGSTRKKFDEALNGPWRYDDRCHSWGWDAATNRAGAMTPQAPTLMPTEGVAAAYWLAWESQPLFPNTPGRGTVGFEPKPRAWTWCTWAERLDKYAVSALIRRPQEASSLGGFNYRAGVTMTGKYGWFESARRT